MLQQHLTRARARPRWPRWRWSTRSCSSARRVRRRDDQREPRHGVKSVIVAGIIALAALVFGWLVPRLAQGEALGVPALTLSILGLLGVLAFWSGVPPTPAAGGACSATPDGRRHRRLCRAAIGVGSSPSRRTSPPTCSTSPARRPALPAPGDPRIEGIARRAVLRRDAAVALVDRLGRVGIDPHAGARRRESLCRGAGSSPGAGRVRRGPMRTATSCSYRSQASQTMSVGVECCRMPELVNSAPLFPLGSTPRSCPGDPSPTGCPHRPWPGRRPGDAPRSGRRR